MTEHKEQIELGRRASVITNLNHENDRLRRENTTLGEELKQVKPFVLAILEYFGGDDCGELDYCDFQDLATQFKVIKWEKYDPQKHGEGRDMDPGDDIWLPAILGNERRGEK